MTLAVGSIPDTLRRGQTGPESATSLLSQMLEVGQQAEFARLSTLLDSDTLNAMPDGFASSEFLLLWPGSSQEREILFEIETTIAELVVTPVALLNANREAIFTGVVSMYLPAKGRRAGEPLDDELQALIAFLREVEGQMVRDREGAEAGIIRGALVSRGETSRFVLATEGGHRAPVAISNSAISVSGNRRPTLNVSLESLPINSQ